MGDMARDWLAHRRFATDQKRPTARYIDVKKVRANELDPANANITFCLFLDGVHDMLSLCVRFTLHLWPLASW